MVMNGTQLLRYAGNENKAWLYAFYFQFVHLKSDYSS